MPVRPAVSSEDESSSTIAERASVDSWDRSNNATDDEHDSLQEEEAKPRLNNVQDLRKGIIKTRQNKTKEYTVLLVGETGTGKTTLLSLFANVSAGKGIKEYVLLDKDKNKVAKNESQTESAMIYEFESRNGVKLRILDTPGLADSRGIAQDNIHKADIADAIKKHVTTVTAVVLLTNGTVERLGVATNYALSTLSSIFPRTLKDNIGVMFTCVPDVLSWNFVLESLPAVLREMEGNRFLIDNPLAKWAKLDALKREKRLTRRELVEMKRKLEECHSGALSTLAAFFDWLDTLSPQPTKDIMNLYERYKEIDRGIANALARASQITGQKKELTRMLTLAESNKITMEQYREVVTTKVIQQVKTVPYNTICRYPGCSSNCCIGCKLRFDLDPGVIEMCYAMDNSKCRRCDHPIKDHYHDRSMWKKRERKQEVIREGLEQKYNVAKRENDENEKRIVHLEEKIAALDEEFVEQLTLLGRLTEDYAHLSLTGSFIGQVKQTIQFLESNLERMRCTGEAAPALVESITKSLDERKETLGVLLQLGNEDPQNGGEASGAISAGTNGGARRGGIVGKIGGKIVTFAQTAFKTRRKSRPQPPKPKDEDVKVHLA